MSEEQRDKSYILDMLNELEGISKEIKDLKEVINEDINGSKYAPIYCSKAKINRTKLNVKESFRRIETKIVDWGLYRFDIREMRKTRYERLYKNRK